MKLTEQEKEICCRIAKGQSFKQVASAMNYHERNINYHVDKLRERFGCLNVPHLIATLMTQDLLS